MKLIDKLERTQVELTTLTVTVPNRAVSPFYVLNLHVAKTCGMAVCTSSGAQSERYLQLNFKDKKRYIAKLSLTDGIDPYILSNKEFSENTAHLPSLR